MSLYDYRVSQQISATDPPFYALIMAAIRKADSTNSALLRSAFPEVYAEFEARYNAPGGIIAADMSPADFPAEFKLQMIRSYTTISGLTVDQEFDAGPQERDEAFARCLANRHCADVAAIFLAQKAGAR